MTVHTICMELPFEPDKPAQKRSLEGTIVTLRFPRLRPKEVPLVRFH